MGGRLLKAVAIITGTFIGVCSVSWEVCSYLGHPHDQGSQWTLCIGLGTVVAAAVQGANMLGAAARSRSTVVKGDDNRVAGAGAHHNAFGDRTTVKGSRQNSGASGPGAGEGTDDSTVQHGNRNRVAGAGAHDNAFGDDSRVE